MIDIDVADSRKLGLRSRLREYSGIAAYWSGASWIHSRLSRGERGVILAYHSVAQTPDSEWIDPANHLALRQFDQQLDFLSRHRRILSIDDLVEATEAGEPIEAGTVVVTFDDGYLDTLREAAPLLEKYEIPACLYLPTGYVDRSERQWIDELYSAFRTRRSHVIEFDERRFDLGESRQLTDAYRALSAKLLVASLRDSADTLAFVRRELNSDEVAPRSTCDWDEIRELAERYPMIAIGAHTHDHIDLSTCSSQQTKDEIDLCVSTFERELGFRPRHFSFPYGRGTCEAREYLRRGGFRSAVVDDEVAIVTGATDPLWLPRIEPPRTMSLFRLRTLGYTS